MTAEVKEFPTTVVASIATMIHMAEGFKFGDIHECAEWIAGHPIWTHEFADKVVVEMLAADAYSQFPNLPTRDEARADFRVAAAKAIAEYGLTVTVTRGNGIRDKHPLDTLQNAAPDAAVIVVSTGDA